MTRTEIIKRIEELETKRFYLAMADHWGTEDYRLDRQWANEIKELKTRVEEEY